jgi:3-oxoadipate enol-lactonase
MQASINGIRMRYEVSGPTSAPAVVLHHPLATDLSIWDELTAALEGRYRVVRFDARGHGQTEAPAGAYDFATLSADVIGLMDHLAIAKARFVGLSMGGMVGQHLGLTHAGRLESLCLVSTASAVPAQGAEIWNERIRLAGSVGMSAVVDGAMARWVAPAVLTDNPPLVTRLKRMILATPPPGYVGWCHAIRALDITARLPAIRLATRVIVGALDPATPPAAAEVIQKAIPGADLVVVPGVSHMLHVEAPAAFHAAVIPFLDACGPRA